MSSLCKCGIRLVETDMSVFAKSKELQINRTMASNNLIISCTFLSLISLHSVWKEDIFHIYIYMVKKVIPHKISITLIVVSRKPHILIEVD